MAEAAVKEKPAAEAEAELMERVQGELRRLAASYMRSERSGHTLQPTALVNEAYAKLFGGEQVDWQNRAHFFAVAARQMRRILVDHARDRSRDKRGGGAIAVPLEDHLAGIAPGAQEDLLSVDQAMTELEKLEPQASRVVELRFFGGLTDKEVAEVLGISFAMVRRDWEFARAWLFRRLSAPSHRAAGA
jgi:RNA polymerase sigma factor (TIGR02999 family)